MTTKDDEYFMKQAIKEALKAAEIDEVPIGAILVIDEQIIARAHNQVELLKDSTAHAEILALTSAYQSMGTKYLPDATLYVTIEPCLMCAGALYWGKVKKVVYGAPDPKNGYKKYMNTTHTEVAGPFHPKATIVTGVCEKECRELIQDFFRSKRL